MTEKGIMSNTVRGCYINFLRYSILLRTLVECKCLVCKFRRLYQVKR